VAEVSPENWEEKRERERKVNALKTFYDDVEKLRNDILIKESKVTYLTGQLIDLEDKQRIWKLRVSDLEFQKKGIGYESENEWIYAASNSAKASKRS